MSQKIKILVVDDDPHVCASLRRTLEYTGRYEVHEAGSGPEGFDLACEVLPDFMFLDMMMPKLNGAELAMMLRADERTAHIPYAFLTGLLDHASAVALEGVIDGERYLAKPASVSELIAVIESVVGR